MKKMVFAAALAAGAMMAGVSAHAMPALQAQASAGGVIQVAEGCGPGGHRNPYGRCVPNYYGPRPYYRACPYGFHLGRFGVCRPN